MLDVKRITKLAAVAAIYVVLTVFIAPLSYRELQLRFSEILVLLCFYRRDYAIALILGTFIANIFSPIPLDMLVGTLATAISVYLISLSRNLIIASIYPAIINGILVGFELNFTFGSPLVLSMVYVAIGEFIVVGIIGVIIFTFLQKNKEFMRFIDANQNYKF